MGNKIIRYKIFYDSDSFAFWQETNIKNIQILTVTAFSDPNSSKKVSVLVTYYEE